MWLKSHQLCIHHHSTLFVPSNFKQVRPSFSSVVSLLLWQQEVMSSSLIYPILITPSEGYMKSWSAISVWTWSLPLAAAFKACVLLDSSWCHWCLAFGSPVWLPLHYMVQKAQWQFISSNSIDQICLMKLKQGKKACWLGLNQIPFRPHL